MNAYELAEHAEGLAYEIPADWSSGEPKNVATDIANMLRQQADRIERKQELIREQTALLVKQNNRIAELEKDLAKYDELAIDDLEGKRIIWCACGDAITPDSGAVCGVCASFRSTKEQSAEPVAWWTGKFEDESEDFMFAKTRQAHIDHAQSCTHEFFRIPLYTTPKIKELSNEEIERIYYKTLNRFDFARAILRKAQNK